MPDIIDKLNPHTIGNLLADLQALNRQPVLLCRLPPWPQGMAYPRPNLNGTSREQLMEQCFDVMTACRELRRALSNMNPHGRDYQTAPDGEFSRATEQHQWRHRVVDDLYREVEAYAQLIQGVD